MRYRWPDGSWHSRPFESALDVGQAAGRMREQLSAVMPPSLLYQVALTSDGPRMDSLLAARWDYVHDVIDVVEFEARVWRVLQEMGKRV